MKSTKLYRAVSEAEFQDLTQNGTFQSGPSSLDMNAHTNDKRRAVARIRWVSPTEGGRTHPPAGPRYSTVAKFEKEAENWPQEAWSILAEFKKISDDLSSIIAEVHCLAPTAPSHLLQPGSKFELYEGSRLVAHGEVLGDSVEPLSENIHFHADVETP